MYEYITEGTCARAIRFDLREGKIHDVSFNSGCPGNLQALGILAEGMEAGELVKKLKGVTCGARGTSCADQFARAITAAMKKGE